MSDIEEIVAEADSSLSMEGMPLTDEYKKEYGYILQILLLLI